MDTYTPASPPKSMADGQRAVSDSGYACDWAAIADLIVDGHLQLPLDRGQLSRLMKSELGRGLFEPEKGAIPPRTLQSDGVTLTTHTPAMADLLDNLLTIAPHDVTILLSGETGTGKTTIARLIHEISPRHGSTFLTVACGAMPPELIESELFGHVKGAFTSADRPKIGKFEAAAGGTLLLDEIDVLKLEQQATLLRVIETGEFEPVGSNETCTSSARLIAASNVDLEMLMQRDEFRSDLYYRLNMLEFHIPPLRERPHDVVPLVLDFVDEFCSAHDIEVHRIHPDFLTCLKSYHWPGNIRELKNHVRRAVLFCQSGELTPKNLAPHFKQAAARQSAAKTDTTEGTLSEKVADREIELLEKALGENGQNRTATAKALGLSRVGLYKKMKRHGLIAPRNPV